MRIIKIYLFSILLLVGIATQGITQSGSNTAKAKQKTQKVQQKEQTVYVTRTGEKYHLGSCRYLRKSKIAMKLSEAKASYSACSVCDPPRQFNQVKILMKYLFLILIAFILSSCDASSSSGSNRCAATTQEGTQCKRNAEPGSSYCWQHK